MLAQTFDQNLKGYGARGPVHQIRFRRRPGAPNGGVHVDYKYWSQDLHWKPKDGSSVVLLKHGSEEHNVWSCSKPIISKRYDDSEEEMERIKRKLLRFLADRQRCGLVSLGQINEWRNFFKHIPTEPTATFPLELPGHMCVVCLCARARACVCVCV